MVVAIWTIEYLIRTTLSYYVFVNLYMLLCLGLYVLSYFAERCDQDDGWVYSRTTDHCYKFFDHQDSTGGGDRGLTHSEAESSCENELAELASVNSIEELAFIQTNILE